ncbi:hypothetical protein [Aminobacter sp. AP02]|uniref:hypothetical protein n=1 Tax=Aminobacter sp. AP02 TaxID=2135737 RepID=UPI000D78F805|nr:hypothetical protein [Aminobacter sp. AP02]PWK73860.1 hypothetical protein C8K44_10431 [Aminobacter sp. AP02]
MFRVPHAVDLPQGTRFRLFPQLPTREEQGEPETVWVSPPAGTVFAGPADARIYVIQPIGKEKPYGYYEEAGGQVIHYGPPWIGPIVPRAEPDREGHFDHIEFGTPQFLQAHAYGAIRFTLDIWQEYFGRGIGWHFDDSREKLEVVFLPGLDNAYAGYGSIEIGSFFTPAGNWVEFGLSFDVISHETGHLIIYGEVGLPDSDNIPGEHFGFHESSADMVSLISLMHFETALIGVLDASHGNLYSYNRLNRFAEVSDLDQLRLASNPLTLYDFVDGWVKEHDLAQPLTGALFDIWVDVFHEDLLRRGLIPAQLEDLSDQLEGDPSYHNVVQPLFDEAYGKNPEGFAACLADARDYMGRALAQCWSSLQPLQLDYAEVARAFLAADDQLNDGRFHRIITGNMERRGIGLVRAGPRLPSSAKDSHSFSKRAPEPGMQQHYRHLPYRTRIALQQRV